MVDHKLLSFVSKCPHSKCPQSKRNPSYQNYHLSCAESSQHGNGMSYSNRGMFGQKLLIYYEELSYSFYAIPYKEGLMRNSENPAAAGVFSITFHKNF